MGFTERFLKSLTNIFLGLHWVAAFYAVVAPALIFGGGFWICLVVGFVCLLLVPLLFAPIGPLSLALSCLLAIPVLTFGSAVPQVHPLLALGVATGTVILKFFIYSAIRRNKLLDDPAIWAPITYTAAVLLILVFAFSQYSLLTLQGMLEVSTFILAFTVPMDLIVFSYVKFRDAVRGAEPRRWILALVALWTAMLWFAPVVVILVWGMWSPDLWNPFTIALVFTRIAITAVQLSYIALFVRSGDAVLLKRMTGEPGSSNPASCA